MRPTERKGRLGALFFLLAFVCALAHAETLPKRIGVTLAGSPPDRFAESLRQGLGEYGWVEGKNLVIEYRYAGGRPDRYRAFIEEFARGGVDVIVSGGGTGAARAALRGSAHIPIVVPIMADPMASGLVENLARPGGRLTGLSLMIADTSGKRAEILRELFPKVRRVAALIDPANDVGQKAATQAASDVFGFDLRIFSAHHPDQLDTAFDQATKDRSEVIIVLSSGMFNANRRRIVALARRHDLPAIYPNREFVEAGGLVSYGVDLSHMYWSAAKYVDKILRGAKPGELPIEQPVKFELLVNARTARDLGLTIPRSISLRADQTIE